MGRELVTVQIMDLHEAKQKTSVGGNEIVDFLVNV